MHWYAIEGLARERHERLLAEAARQRLVRALRDTARPRRLAGPAIHNLLSRLLHSGTARTWRTS